MSKAKEVLGVRAPRWVHSRKNAIDCEVRISGADWERYTATEYDTDPTGKAIWEMLMAGKGGAISEDYVLTDAAIRSARVSAINRTRMQKLAQAMAWESGLRTMKTAKAAVQLASIQKYREALMDLESQPGYPFEITPPKDPWI